MNTDGILNQFLADIAGEASEPLPQDEQQVLIEIYRAGGPDADESRQILIEHNLRLVVSIAKRYRDNGVPFVDLIQEGTLGLIQALDEYDPSRGVFSTCAHEYIRREITRCLCRDSRTIRIPEWRVWHLRAIRAAQQKLAQVLDRAPSTDEIAEETGLSSKVVKHLLVISSTGSLDQEVADGKASAIVWVTYDELPVEDQVADRELIAVLDKALDALPDPRQRHILERYYGWDSQSGEGYVSMAVIAEEIGRTRERVRQLRDEALEHLQKYLVPDPQAGYTNRPPV